jgi:hypothetical protein
MRLTPIPAQIYELVRRRPRTKSEIIDAIWWLHPAEAPQPSAIKAHIWHANQVLKARGEKIISTRGMHTEMPYRVVKLA